jgi:hypothetical protein
VVFDAAGGDVQLSHCPYANALTPYWGGLADPNYKWADTITEVGDETRDSSGSASASGTANIGSYDMDPRGETFISAEVNEFDNTDIDEVYVIMTGGD